MRYIQLRGDIQCLFSDVEASGGGHHLFSRHKHSVFVTGEVGEAER